MRNITAQELKILADYYEQKAQENINLAMEYRKEEHELQFEMEIVKSS